MIVNYVRDHVIGQPSLALELPCTHSPTKDCHHLDDALGSLKADHLSTRPSDQVRAFLIRFETTSKGSRIRYPSMTDCDY